MVNSLLRVRRATGYTDIECQQVLSRLLLCIFLTVGIMIYQTSEPLSTPRQLSLLKPLS